MPTVAVTKMHGTLNDFVVVDQRASGIGDLAAFARRVCDRRAGIGADGLIALLPSRIAHARMVIVNADGSEAEMCGNGMRCAVRYLSERGEGEEFCIETLAGIIGAHVMERGETYQIRLDMGIPVFEDRPIPVPDSVFVSLGNPHVVIFASALDAIDLPETARRLRQEPAFSDGTNVHVAVRKDSHHVDVRHWERGVGLTYACGTGAVATAAAGMKLGMLSSPVEVHVPGGELHVEWDGTHHAFLTGPAVRVFDTEVTTTHALIG